MDLYNRVKKEFELEKSDKVKLNKQLPLSHYFSANKDTVFKIVDFYEYGLGGRAEANLELISGHLKHRDGKIENPGKRIWVQLPHIKKQLETFKIWW